MTAVDGTPAPECSGSQALAWTQTAITVVCLALTVIFGLYGPMELALAVAGLGAAAIGGIQITVHIRR